MKQITMEGDKIELMWTKSSPREFSPAPPKWNPKKVILKHCAFLLRLKDYVA